MEIAFGDRSIEEVVKSRLCMSCGACVVAAPEGTLALRYDPKEGLLLPEATGRGAFDAREVAAVCPGKGVPLERLAKRFLDTDASHHVDLGYWNGLWAARCTDRSMAARASSGGVMTAVARHLLDAGLVESVVATRLVYGTSGPRTETFLARSPEALLEAQGSKYCPVPAVEILAAVRRNPRPVAFVGTPCQIAAVRMLQERFEELRESVRFTIGNFCGGFRDYREMHALIRKYGLDASRVTGFRYRGGGQPGSLRIEDTDGKTVTRPYPAYVRDTGIPKNRRCLLCVDATAELADFACGDAWLDRFLESGHAWSLVATRTRAARDIVKQMIENGRLLVEDVSPDEVRKSQAVNLTSKKRRQAARRRLYGLLGWAVPEYDGGYGENGGSIAFEAFVEFCRHVAERAELGSRFFGILRAAGRTLKTPLRRMRDGLKR